MKARTAGLVLAAVAAAAAAWLLLRPHAGPYDVLVVVIDTTRADRCSLYGYERPTTPRLEEIAAECDVYEDAWSPSAWTVPAHASLFTGVRADRLGLVDEGARALGTDMPTLAGILSGQGWSTACFTCNGWIGPHTGLTRGFGLVKPYFEPQGRGMAAAAHADALEWMAAERAAGRRFFAFVNDVEPHAPWNPAPRWREKFVPEDVPAEAVAEVPSWFGDRNLAVAAGLFRWTDDLRRAASHLYDAEVAALDDEVGSLVARMRARGLLESTLVVIVSDHGEGLMDHGVPEHAIDSHREILRVPLLVRRPGAPAPRRIGDVVRLEDLFPTVLEAAGAPVPDGIDGRSLDGDLADRLAIGADCARGEWCDDVEALCGPGTGRLLRRSHRSIYDGKHHLIVDGFGNVQMYEPASDPLEKRDLSSERPGEVDRLRALLDAAR